ncbi:unnamed protein product [Phaeothamnion confervicola]
MHCRVPFPHSVPSSNSNFLHLSFVQRRRSRDMQMGKVSKFGIFSPAVVVAKVVLGEARLNKIRGKAIALHSQAITEYCNWVGASSSMRGQLIKKAKNNGDTLGFLW